MTIHALIVLIKVLLAILASLYITIVFIKVWQSVRAKKQAVYSQSIREWIERLLSESGPEHEEWRKEYIWEVYKNMKKPLYEEILETIFMQYLEEPGRKNRSKIVSIAHALGFPPLCLRQIRSRSGRNIAFGCRKAGLYRYERAIPDMLGALSVFSSETQFQILMGLSRIGNVDAMRQAFETVSRYVMINERAAYEILYAFSGDKCELYKHMINCGNDYISALFLKSLDAETARTLSDDIVEVLGSGSKERRIAAIKAIGQTGDHALVCHLVKSLSDEDWEIRAIAAKMLGVLADSCASSALASALRDREWWVRQNAASSLLSYPDFEDTFLDVIKTNDAFARDSIVYALESAEKYDILEKIQSESDKSGAEEPKSAGNLTHGLKLSLAGASGE